MKLTYALTFLALVAIGQNSFALRDCGMNSETPVRAVEFFKEVLIIKSYINMSSIVDDRAIKITAVRDESENGNPLYHLTYKADARSSAFFSDVECDRATNELVQLRSGVIDEDVILEHSANASYQNLRFNYLTHRK